MFLPENLALAGDAVDASGKFGMKEVEELIEETTPFQFSATITNPGQGPPRLQQTAGSSKGSEMQTAASTRVKDPLDDVSGWFASQFPDPLELPTLELSCVCARSPGRKPKPLATPPAIAGSGLLSLGNASDHWEAGSDLLQGKAPEVQQATPVASTTEGRGDDNLPTAAAEYVTAASVPHSLDPPAAAAPPAPQTLQSNEERSRTVTAQEAAAWVGAVTVKQPPQSMFEQGIGSTACEAALQDWLKSGELLCTVINRVRPGAVGSISPAQGGGSTFDATGNISPFKMMANVTQYVTACKTLLNMPAQDLFDATDLCEGRDMRAVVRNLHSLGRIAQQLEVDGLPTLGAKLAARNERQFSEAQLAEARAAPRRFDSFPRRGAPNNASPASDVSEQPPAAMIHDV